VEFTAAADELYGVAPPEFVATRRRLAGGLSREDARRLTALRRPTVPAWAVNLLVRDGSAGGLLDLGERMREAWASGGDLADLERERTSMVDDLVSRARTLTAEAGRPLSDAFATEVEDTLRAAVADQSAADAVRAGRLDHPLRHAGFGSFGGVAPAPASRRERPADKARARREEKARREDASRRAEEAARALAEWADARETARARLADVDERLGWLRIQVRSAEEERAGMEREARVAEREHERAVRADKEARKRLAALEPEGPKAL
jgi:hypothetical protein